MVKPFTEEQKRRFREETEQLVKKHEERFHGGEVTRCNYYSECHAIERSERAAKSDVG